MDILTAYSLPKEGMAAIECLSLLRSFSGYFGFHSFHGRAFTLPASGVGKVKAMSANERRRKIMYYLNDHRKTTYVELKSYFEVSYNTIRRDIQILTCEYPITVTPGMYGGITGNFA